MRTGRTSIISLTMAESRTGPTPFPSPLLPQDVATTAKAATTTTTMDQHDVVDPTPHRESGQKMSESGTESNNALSTASISDQERRVARVRYHEWARKIRTIVSWTPKRCRWDPDLPPKFGLGLNLLFAFVSAKLPTLTGLSYPRLLVWKVYLSSSVCQVLNEGGTEACLETNHRTLAMTN